MNKLIIRWAINAVALYVAVAIVPGIRAPVDASWLSYIWLALIFGLLNAILRPILKLLTCPLILLTLGLFTLLLNTLLFWMAGVIGTQFGIGFTVRGFPSAFFGALVVSVISVVLTLLMKDEMEDRKKK